MQVIKLNQHYIDRFYDLLTFLKQENKDTFELGLTINQIENNVLTITNEQFTDIYDSIIDYPEFIDLIELLIKNERNILTSYE